MTVKHTATIFRWQKQVNEDAALPVAAAKVVIYLSNLFNEDEGGVAWPSCKTIGEAICKSEATVIDVVRQMAARGHLRIEWGRQGRGRSNRYWMIEKDRDQADLFEPKKPQKAKVSEPRKPQLSPSRKPQVSGKKPQVSERKPWNPKETLSETHRRLTEVRDSLPDDASLGKGSKRRARKGSKPQAEPNREAEQAEAFKRFWAVYPRHVAAAAARKAFARAIEDTDPEVIIAGAQRYALAERMRLTQPGQTAQHTAYAATWLRDERWNDPPVTDGNSPPTIIDNETGERVTVEPPSRDAWDQIVADLSGEDTDAEYR